jgi:hypothetical protein
MRKSNEQSKRSRYDDKSAELRGFHAVHVLPAHTYARTRIAGQHTTSFLEKMPSHKKKGKRKTSPHDVDRDETTVDHTGALFE